MLGQPFLGRMDAKGLHRETPAATDFTSASRASRTSPEFLLGSTAAIVKGFGCRPHEGRRGEFGGQRPKASKEGNRA
jgi:hypothetical protein